MACITALLRDNRKHKKKDKVKVIDMGKKPTDFLKQKEYKMKIQFGLKYT